jgi:hypothetical protein
MKKIISLNLLLIFTLLTTACSTKSIPKKSHTIQPSVYNIMGISEPKKEIVHFVVKDDKNLKNIYKRENSQLSNDIEFISYKHKEEYFDFTNKLQPYSINDIERTAKSFLGTPYLWGATGPNKFDCSGFTQWVFRDAGINIPRVSREQAKVGKYVRFEELQRGDMVFFDTKKHRTGKVCHVGIYLGNGDFIHASSSGKKVVIFNFNKKTFYKKRFLWGRRVINNDLHYASK